MKKKNLVLDVIIVLLSVIVATAILYPALAEKAQKDLITTVDEVYKQAFNGRPISYEQTLEIEKKYNDTALEGLTDLEISRIDSKIRFIADAYSASQIPVVDLRNRLED